MTDPDRHDPEAPTTCPWGEINDVWRIGDGIYQIDAARHGGIYVSPRRYAEIPDILRVVSFTRDQYFEEDASVAAAHVAFPGQLDQDLPEAIAQTRDYLITSAAEDPHIHAVLSRRVQEAAIQTPNPTLIDLLPADLQHRVTIALAYYWGPHHHEPIAPPPAPPSALDIEQHAIALFRAAWQKAYSSDTLISEQTGRILAAIDDHRQAASDHRHSLPPLPLDTPAALAALEDLQRTAAVSDADLQHSAIHNVITAPLPLSPAAQSDWRALYHAADANQRQLVAILANDAPAAYRPWDAANQTAEALSLATPITAYATTEIAPQPLPAILADRDFYQECVDRTQLGAAVIAATHASETERPDNRPYDTARPARSQDSRHEQIILRAIERESGPGRFVLNQPGNDRGNSR